MPTLCSAAPSSSWKRGKTHIKRCDPTMLLNKSFHQRQTLLSEKSFSSRVAEASCRCSIVGQKVFQQTHWWTAHHLHRLDGRKFSQVTSRVRVKHVEQFHVIRKSFRKLLRDLSVRAKITTIALTGLSILVVLFFLLISKCVLENSWENMS